MHRINVVPVALSFVCGVVVGALLSLRRKENKGDGSTNQKEMMQVDAFTGWSGAIEEEERFDIPENAPDHCPGIENQEAGGIVGTADGFVFYYDLGKSEACAGCPNQSICASGELKGEDPGASEVRTKLASVKKKIIVLSGKGGVGKSTISSQLSWALQDRGFHVGLLDIDVCGPSVPMMTGCKGSDVHASADGWSPVYVGDSLAVMSIGFLLPDQDDAVIWRGPKKNGLIRQFLTDVTWGDLDVLVIDTPPGTSDEHLSIVTYLKEAGIDGAIVVTTPQEVALQDVRKEINFCKKVQVPVIGVVENMTDSVFDSRTGAAMAMCIKMDVPYAGSLPLDRDLLLACESGRSLATVNAESPAFHKLNVLVDDVLAHVGLSLPSVSPDAYSQDGVVQIPL